MASSSTVAVNSETLTEAINRQIRAWVDAVPKGGWGYAPSLATRKRSGHVVLARELKVGDREVASVVRATLSSGCLV
jgi:hypothetical protein